MTKGARPKVLSLNLAPYVSIDCHHAIAKGETLPNRVHGAALFADILGFTPLTTALAAKLDRQRGAEVVLDYVNPMYAHPDLRCSFLENVPYNRGLLAAWKEKQGAE
jgi:hypothetical protein